MRNLWVLVLGLAAAACSHISLSGSELDRVRRPAFISRIEDEAGPRSSVFRDDGAYGAKLKKLEPKEADRRLQAKLKLGMTRFELADRLRAQTVAALPQEGPWTNVVDPAAVATVLQSFLVQEVPANPPDYDLLKELGADSVVEFVVQDYGMRSSGGRAGPFLKGYARMFFIDGRREIWWRRFDEDAVSLNLPHLDPFAVGKDPNEFRLRMVELIDRVTAQVAKDLNPPDRVRRAKAEDLKLGGPTDDTSRTGKDLPPPRPPEDELPAGELPPPDAK